MLYKYVLENYANNINKIYVTELYKSIECDKFFPIIDKNKYSLEKVSNFKKEIICIIDILYIQIIL